MTISPYATRSTTTMRQSHRRRAPSPARSDDESVMASLQAQLHFDLARDRGVSDRSWCETPGTIAVVDCVRVMRRLLVRAVMSGGGAVDDGDDDEQGGGNGERDGDSGGWGTSVRTDSSPQIVGADDDRDVGPPWRPFDGRCRLILQLADSSRFPFRSARDGASRRLRRVVCVVGVGGRSVGLLAARIAAA